MCAVGTKIGYRDFSKAAGLITQNERLNVAGFGKAQAAGVNKAIARQKAVAKVVNTEYKKQKTEIRNLIRREYSLDVNESRQGKHIRGHNNFDPTRSELTANPHELAKLYAGNGEPKISKGKWTEKEWFSHYETIGIWRDEDGLEIQTSTGMIHYSKTRACISSPPSLRRQKKMIQHREISHLFGKQVKVTCTDGYSEKGILTDYTTAKDNEPDPASVTVRLPSGMLSEIYMPDIQSIEEIIRRAT